MAVYKDNTGSVRVLLYGVDVTGACVACDVDTVNKTGWADIYQETGKLERCSDGLTILYRNKDGSELVLYSVRANDPTP